MPTKLSCMGHGIYILAIILFYILLCCLEWLKKDFFSFFCSGLGSILFAITVDRPELNKAYQNTLHVGNGGEVIIPGTTDDEPRAIIAGDSSPIGLYSTCICIILN